jgi:hypothetical protein
VLPFYLSYYQGGHHRKPTKQIGYHPRLLDEADDDLTTNDVESSPPQKATQVIFHELRYFLSSGDFVLF